MPPHPLTNFEIIDYFKNEPRFNGVYSRNNLPKTIKNGIYVINLDEFKNTGTHWIVLFVRELNSKNKKVIYFDSFGVEHIPKEILNKVGINKDIKSSIFRIQDYNSVMYDYFCISFTKIISYVKYHASHLICLKYLDFTELFSPNDFEKNDKISRYFKQIRWDA